MSLSLLAVLRLRRELDDVALVIYTAGAFLYPNKEGRYRYRTSREVELGKKAISQSRDLV